MKGFEQTFRTYLDMLWALLSQYKGVNLGENGTTINDKINYIGSALDDIKASFEESNKVLENLKILNDLSVNLAVKIKDHVEIFRILEGEKYDSDKINSCLNFSKECVNYAEQSTTKAFDLIDKLQNSELKDEVDALAERLDSKGELIKKRIEKVDTLVKFMKKTLVLFKFSN